MLEVNCIKFSLGIQNSLGMIMCKFHARQSKTEGMAASVRVFLEHPSYSFITYILCTWNCMITKTASPNSFTGITCLVHTRGQ